MASPRVLSQPLSLSSSPSPQATPLTSNEEKWPLGDSAPKETQISGTKLKRNEISSSLFPSGSTELALQLTRLGPSRPVSHSLALARSQRSEFNIYILTGITKSGTSIVEVSAVLYGLLSALFTLHSQVDNRDPLTCELFLALLRFRSANAS